jgi:hypothetical protein
VDRTLSSARRRLITYTLVAVGWAIILLLLWSYSRGEVARLYYLSSNNDNPLAAADMAVSLNPYDPNAHFIRAGVFIERKELTQAIIEIEAAINLRPRDFSLWLMLGDWRLQNKDEEGAMQAYLNAIHLAPHYAEPHRALGNLFRAQGRLDDAFKELRSALAINPALLPEVIDAAMEVYNNDATAVRATIQPQAPFDYLVLANAFFDKGNMAEAISLFRAAGDVDVAERHNFITRLLEAKRFRDAFEIWANFSPEEGIDRNYLGTVTNPSFEKPIDPEDVGFDWHIDGSMKNIKASLDRENPFAGAASLRLDFEGNSNTSSPLIYQLVLVEPNTKYRLTFAVRSEELVTGAPPVMIVTDANSNKPLAQSSAIPESVKGWQSFTLDCATTEQTRAITVSIQRKGKDPSAYPIFGRMWIDEVLLEKS